MCPTKWQQDKNKKKDNITSINTTTTAKKEVTRHTTNKVPRIWQYNYQAVQSTSYKKGRALNIRNYHAYGIKFTHVKTKKLPTS